MGVANCDGTVADGLAEVFSHRGGDGVPGRTDVGDPVEHVGEHAQQPGTTRVVEGQRAHDPIEHFDVVGQCFGFGVDDDERRTAESIQRAVAGGVE